MAASSGKTSSAGASSVGAPSVAARKVAASAVKTDVLVIGVAPTGKGKAAGGLALAPGASDVDAAFDGKLAQTLSTLGATGKAEEVTIVPGNGGVAAPVIAVVGLGGDKPSAETLRRAAGAVVRRFDGRATSLAFALGLDDATDAGALAEGALLGAYRYDEYRTAPNGTRKSLSTITLVGDAAPAKAVKDAVSAAAIVARAVNLSRSWVNTPPLDLYPETFAAAAKAEAKRVGAKIEILDVKALTTGGYGGILGVGQGSERGPRLVKLSYSHPKAKRTLALVGKGITFDSGGLSLKPNDGMKTMKCDMGGAAAVLAAVLAIAELGLPISVTAWAAMAENMPSGTAQRPSDVLRMYGGKTVEVLNTDAEGRLVMADALVRASEDKPDVLIDVATLTGACMIALGDRTFGIMGNDVALRDEIQEAGKLAGEDAWPLPIPEGSREKLDSKVADIANVGSTRYGGALTAAAFLEEFVGEGIRWAHLDIAGPAFNEGGPFGYTPTGGTGTATRTLIKLAGSF